MVYNYNEAVTKKSVNRFTILIIALIFAIFAVVAVLTPVNAKSKTSNNAGSLGQVTLDTDISAGVNYGDGILNGEWVVAEKQGVELGARVTDRTDGLLDVSGVNGDRVGVYEAATGFDGDTTNRAEWNYEWSVDLSNAKGNAEGKTLSDYSLTLEQNYTNQSLFNLLGSDPVFLPMPETCDAVSDTLCQQSWNPTFGNDDFDPEAEGVYNLRFVLTPLTFNGPPLAVTVQVNVTNQ